MDLYILGLSYFYHDAAACLLKNGEIAAAAQEERFTRKKHDADFPKNAIEYCLKEAGITIKDIDYIGFYEKPFIKFERLLETYLTMAPRGIYSFLKSMPVWIREKLWIAESIKKELDYDKEIIFIDHHLSHAASTFFPSTFEDAAILTVDGVGEWTTTAYGYGKGKEITLTHEIKFPHSLGLLYSAFTDYLGFKINSGEYKVMGLAPYGKPIYYNTILGNLIFLKDDGSFKLNMDFFAYAHTLKMYNKKFEELFGYPKRESESKLEQHHFDIASSIQLVTEEVMLRMVNHLHKETLQENLCLAGGVALNAVANGRILKESPFKNIFIQPAAGDAGGAYGVAAFIHHSLYGDKTKHSMKMPYYGPMYSNDEIRDFLNKNKVKYIELDRDVLLKQTAKLIVAKQVIGWFQGRMEWGPRALGSRSIIADPRDFEMRDVVNLKIKFRESFRPFAPTVLLEKASEFFEIDCPSPYMLLVAQVKKDKRVIPAVTHVDGSARLQTIAREDNPLFYDLINEFYKLTGVPVIINTSFNVRGEPIVCTPADAYMCFMRTKMDYLVMGNFLIDKVSQTPLKSDIDWQKKYELD